MRTRRAENMTFDGIETGILFIVFMLKKDLILIQI